MLAAERGEMGSSLEVCRGGIGTGDGVRDEGTEVGDLARELVDIASILDMFVILAGNPTFDFLTKVGVFEGVNVSGVRTTPWNELVELVRSVRPSTK